MGTEEDQKKEERKGFAGLSPLVCDVDTFDLDDIDHFTTPAVSFFLGLPGPRHPKQAFDVMVAAARKLSQELNGELKDDQRSVLTAQTIEHYRQRIVEFERRQMTIKQR